MRQSIPYKKLIRFSLTTAIIFGLIGAAPVLEFERKEFARVVSSFFLVSGVTFVLWIVNTALLWASQKFISIQYHYWFRYLLSAAFFIIIIAVIYSLLPSRGHLPSGLRRGIPPFPNLPPAGNFPRPRFLLPILQVGLINIIIVILLEMILLRDTKLHIENENNLLRMANLEAKHSQLKQQLHPHFLFNSLNILKALIKRFPDQAEDYLERLSEILRFSVSSNTQVLISLRQELELVRITCICNKCVLAVRWSIILMYPPHLH